MHGPLIFLDLETTGIRTTRDRITEIAALRLEQGVVTARWHRLINPEMRIPAPISELTGIHDAMVEDAPTFSEIASELSKWLADAPLVAHNARFDYGFLRNAYRRAGRDFSAEVICTLRLSRRLAPQHREHNLAALLERHGIASATRHHAMADAEALLALWQCWQREHSAARLEEEAQRQCRLPSLPAHLDPGMIQALPQTPGVYLMHGENDLPLYIGKSVNLRARVMSHFQADHREEREMRLAQQVRRIDWQETAGDLGAQLLEARLVKERQPILNRRLRRAGRLTGWSWPQGASRPELRRAHALTGREAEEMMGLFRSARDAKEALRQIAADQRLCLRLLGLEAGRGACFASQLGRCRGACRGVESPTEHAARAREALSRLQIHHWPWEGRLAIGERGPTDAQAWHLVDHWCHLASTYSLAGLNEIAEPDDARGRFDVDTYRILRRFLDGESAERLTLVTLPRQTGPAPLA
ncbi:exonuclease domain-containing protein [Halomonas sp. RA08-2]|uniref:3'-5' exonuclease family protein n=1 Tax=Halomonas sp. RA08-2 TaxID=3440842 RepID=UPI003EECF37E